MLPSLSNTLRVVLCPEKVILLGKGRGWSRNINFQTILPCALTDGDVPWRKTIQLLEGWLKEHPQPRSRVEIILSNRFLRYLLIPWSAEVKSAEEELVLARAMFEEVYGDVSKGWKVVVSDTGFQHSKLAVATEAEFIQSIKDVVLAAHQSIDSIQPWLAVAYDHFKGQLTEKNTLLSIVESGQIVTLAFQKKALSGVRKDILAEADRIHEHIHRHRMYFGLGMETPVFLHRDGRKQQLDKADDKHIHELQIDTVSDQLDMAVAETGRQSWRLNFHDSLLDSSREGWGIFSSGILLAIGLAYNYTSSLEYQERINSEIQSKAASTFQAYDLYAGENASEKMKRAAGVIDQLSFPWNQLFRALEAVAAKDVVLLAVKPNMQTNSFTLEGEAKTWEAMVGYLRRLQAESLFSRAQLSSHQIQMNEPHRPVRFIIQCEWMISPQVLPQGS